MVSKLPGLFFKGKNQSCWMNNPVKHGISSLIMVLISSGSSCKLISFPAAMSISGTCSARPSPLCFVCDLWFLLGHITALSSDQVHIHAWLTVIVIQNIYDCHSIFAFCLRLAFSQYVQPWRMLSLEALGWEGGVVMMMFWFWVFEGGWGFCGVILNL